MNDTHSVATAGSPRPDQAQGDDGSAPRRPRGSFTETLLLATTAASIAAAWQLAGVLRLALTGEITHVGNDYTWMAPVANLTIWLAIAIPSGLIARWLPRPVALRLATIGFFSLAALSILLPQTAIARYAVAVLAFGVGVGLSRAVVDAPDRWLRRCAIVAATLLLTMGGAALAISGRSTLASRSAPATLPVAAGARPNVLLIVIDAGRADALSSYGYPRATTPTLDTFADSGTLFELALSTAPWTLPSHVTMFSGRYVMPDSGRTFHFRRPMRTSFPVLAESYRDAGYATAAFVANFYYTGRDTGIDRGFTTYRDYRRTFEELMRSSTLGQTALARGLYQSRTREEAWAAVLRSDFTVPVQPQHARKPATVVTNQFLDFVARRTSRPYFAFLNYFDVHMPYDPPPAFATKFASSPNARDRYDASYAYIDAEIGRIEAALRENGTLDNTLIVVTSDHGELFGEHGLYEHTSNLYLPVLHVPLIIRYPARVPAGHRVAAPVSLRDLAATLTDLSGLTPAAPFPGVSLAAHFGGDRVPSTSPTFAAVERGVRTETGLPFTKGAMQSLLDERWHFIRIAGTDERELYDYRADPQQVRNLAADPAYDSVHARLKQALDRLLTLGPTAMAAEPTESEPLDEVR